MSMKRFRARRAVLASLCGLAASASFSCALFGKRAAPRVLEAPPASSGGMISVAARFVAPDDKVPGFFKTTLAEKGILAVQAVLRNDGPSPLVVHASNGMDIGPEFAGVRLVRGADTLPPLHPGAVSAVIMGARRSSGYRHPGALEIVASPILPPFGVYTLYKEASVGRFYRPLFSRSLHPPLGSGLLAPIRLEPGEERRGWLYFEAPPGGAVGDCEMIVAACAPIEAPEAIDGYEFEFSREEERAGADETGAGGTSAGGPGGERGDGGFLLSLIREGKRSGLYFTEVRALLDDPKARPSRVADVTAKSAEIADVSRRGDRAAVALNFTSKSRTIVFDCGAGPAPVYERALSRGIARVFSVEDGTCAVTENGFGHFFGEGTREGVPGTKLARGFGDAALSGGRLFVFTEEKGLLLFEAGPRSRFAPAGKAAPGRGRREVAGALGGSLVLLCRGVPLAGDTLVFFDPSTMAEVRRGALAGRALRASTAGSSVVLQLEDGTILRIAAGPLGSFRIIEAGWLPFAARALEATPDSFVAVGPDGSFASGRIAAYRPGPACAVEVSARVE